MALTDGRPPVERFPVGGWPISASVAAQIQAAAHDVFTSAFVNAMRPTLFIGVAVVLTAAGAALFSRAHPDEGTTADARRELTGERLADQRVAAV